MKTGWSKEIFANNLQKLMDERGLTQKDIADIVRVSPPTVSYWLDKKKYPRIDKIEILANYFGVLKSYLTEQPSSVPMATPQEVGTMIKNQRLQKGFTSEEFSEKIGISTQDLDNWEDGNRPTVTTDQVKLAAKLLDLNPLSLLGIRDLGRQSEKIIISADDFSKEDFARIKHYIEFLKFSNQKTAKK